jgi:hypothetical protein
MRKQRPAAFGTIRHPGRLCVSLAGLSGGLPTGGRRRGAASSPDLVRPDGGARRIALQGRGLGYRWIFTDGTTAEGARVERAYPEPGSYAEILKVVDDAGNTDIDFAVVQVIDREHPDRLPPTIHAAYAPTWNIRPGYQVTFKVRTFRTTSGEETWDFGDGSPPVTVRSDGNVRAHDPLGYAETDHRYEEPGTYIVKVHRTDEYGQTATARLVVRVE